MSPVLFTSSRLGHINTSAGVLWSWKRVAETHFSNTTLVAETFFGLLILTSLHPLSLFSNVNTERCSLAPPAETNTTETCWFLWMSNCSSSNLRRLLDFILSLVFSHVGSGGVLSSPKVHEPQTTKPNKINNVGPEFRVCLLRSYPTSLSNTYGIKHFVFILQMQMKTGNGRKLMADWG